MPRKRKQSTPVTPPKKEIVQGRYWTNPEAVWGGFINIRLEDEQRELFEAWYVENSAHVGVDLDDLLAEGVKFGLSYDKENECYVATIMGALVGGSNERYVLTSRAGTVNDTIGLAVWKFSVLAGGDCGNYAPKTGKIMNWG